jgi:N-acetylglucosamine malate deacetylase 1
MTAVLVVAPHPDDETLGCGGTLLRHFDEGDEIHWLIMTTINEQAGFSQNRVESRKKEINDIAKKYGFTSIHQCNFITTTLDMIAKNDLINEISGTISRVKPEIVYVPFRNDAHSDHEIVFDAVASCTKSFRYPYVKRVRAYETLSETEFGIKSGDTSFVPNLWVNISNFLNKKIEIMEMYTGEMGAHPFPRSERNIRALATFRGATAGVDAAEAFLSLKEII